MKEEINYKIHDFLEFKIIRDKRFDIAKDLNFKYSYFEVDEIYDPDIILNIGKFVPSNHDCYLVDHKYHIKDNYFYCRDAEGSIGWEFEMFGIEKGKTIVNFNSNIFGLQKFIMGDLLPQNLILAPLLEYKLLQKGCLLVHAGAVSQGDKGFLLVGRGGSFKTTLIMDFIRNHDFHLLSDDTVIIHNNKIYAFPAHLIEFEFRLKRLKTEHMSILNKLQLIKYLFYHKNYNAVDVPIAESVDFSQIYFISKTNYQAMRHNQVEKNEIISKFVLNNKIEKVQVPFLNANVGHFLQYMIAYSYIYTNSKIATYWDDLKTNLEQQILNIPVCIIELPDKYDSKVFNDVLLLIKENK